MKGATIGKLVVFAGVTMCFTPAATVSAALSAQS